MKRVSKRLVSLLVALCIILTLVPMSSAVVQEDYLQLVFIGIMGADDTQRVDFKAVLDSIDNNSYVVTDQMAIDAQAIPALKDMLVPEVKVALQSYAVINPDKKPDIKDAIISGLPTLAGSTSGFPGIRSIINTDVMFDSSNDNGLRFVVQIFQTVSMMLYVDTSNQTKFAKNSSLDQYDIDFNIPRYNVLKGMISKAIRSYAQAFTTKIGSTTDTDAFDKAVTYYKDRINSQSNSEIYNFKCFLRDNGIEFEGTPYWQSASPAPSTVPSTVPTAAPTIAPTIAPTSAPTTPPTVTVKPSSTPIAAPSVAAIPTAPPPVTAISEQVKVLDTTSQTSIGSQQVTSIVNALNTINTNIANTNETVTTGNLAAVVSAINNVTSITGGITDAAAKTQVITSVTNTYGQVVNAANTVMGETNAVTVASSLSSLVSGAGNLLAAASTEQKTEIAGMVTNVLSSITLVAEKAQTETATLQIIDSIIKTVDNIDNVANAAGSADLKTSIQNKTADILKSTASILSNVKSEDNALIAVQQVAALVDRTAGVLSATEEKNSAQKLMNSVKDVVKGTVDVISNVSTTEKAVDMVGSITKAIVRVAENSDLAGIESRKATEQLVKIADKVVEKVAKEQLTPSLKDGKTVAEISQDKENEIIEKAKKVVEVADSLKKEMKDNGLNKPVEKKVIIDIPAQNNASAVKTEFPTSLLTNVKSNGIEKVEIASGVAKLSVEPNFIKEADVKSVSLEVDKKEDGKFTVINLTAKATDKNGKETLLSQFNNKIRIEVPYTLKAGDDPEKITVMFVANNGKETNMTAKYDSETKTVSFFTDHFSKYVITSNTVNFKDVPNDHWAKSYIEALAAKGIVMGRISKDSFLPSANVTRAEFAKFISIALNMVDSAATANFKDVAKSDRDYMYIASAVKSGIIVGRPDGTFAPNETISRQDITVMLARALKETDVSNADNFVKFNDKSGIAGYAMKPMALCVKYGLIAGKPGNIVDPKGQMTRAEAATVIYRLYNN